MRFACASSSAGAGWPFGRGTPEAAARREFEGIDHWAVDPAWRMEARFEPTPGRTIRVPDVLGIDEDDESPGDVVFELDGVTHRLQALPGGDTGELWLVFGDATNGHETYGGGRFLYTGAPDADGRVDRRLQPRLQPAVRVQSIRDLPAAVAGKPPADPGRGRRA